MHYTDVEGSGFRSLAEGEKLSYEAAWITRGVRKREEAREVHRIR